MKPPIAMHVGGEEEAYIFFTASPMGRNMSAYEARSFAAWLIILADLCDPDGIPSFADIMATLAGDDEE